MKKFFLSLAVMLSAATMNVNAMSDSFIFNYTPTVLLEMCKQDPVLSDKVRQEGLRLVNEILDAGGEDLNSRILTNLNAISAKPNVKLSCIVTALYLAKKNEVALEMGLTVDDLSVLDHVYLR